MIQSMTAFALHKKNIPQGQIIWEIRSVNHRYLEMHIRLPDTLSSLESSVREHIRNAINRGKVDCTLRFQATAATQNLNINKTALDQLIIAYETIATKFAASGPVNIMDVLTYPNIVQINEISITELEKPILSLLDLTLTDLCETRTREGKKLADVIQSRISALKQEIEKVTTLYPTLVPKFKERLNKKFEEIKPQLDPARLEQEIILFANKIDIAEEIDRLRVHIEEVERLLKTSSTNGRRFDFLMQELTREANTLGAKSTDTAIIHASVEMKVIIEQMREQIQNIE